MYILKLQMADVPGETSLHSAQYKVKGHVIALPQKTLSVHAVWPISPKDLASSMNVVLLGSGQKFPDLVQAKHILGVRGKVVKDALQWFTEQPWFQEVKRSLV
jgi:hypothetical protein